MDNAFGWSNNPNAWTTIYTGSNTSFTETGITTAMDSVQWRVRAKDSKDAYSAYTTSQVKTVTHNADPTVSGADANLGAVTSPPSRAYTVGDVDDGDTLTIVEALDGSEVRTIADAERGKTYTFGLTAAQFAALAAGEHSMTITVTDSAGNSATRVVTFSRRMGTSPGSSAMFLTFFHWVMAACTKSRWTEVRVRSAMG